MGVPGLWQIVTSGARRLDHMSALEGKVLAIDASGWLYHFIKVKRDESFSDEPWHLIGTFQRLCKLMYLGIRPVLVFDGVPPDIKKQTLAFRRRLRDDAEVKRKKLAEKIVTAQWKKVANSVAKRKREQSSNETPPLTVPEVEINAPIQDNDVTIAEEGPHSMPLPAEEALIGDLHMAREARARRVRDLNSVPEELRGFVSQRRRLDEVELPSTLLTPSKQSASEQKDKIVIEETEDEMERLLFLDTEDDNATNALHSELKAEVIGDESEYKSYRFQRPDGTWQYVNMPLNHIDPTVLQSLPNKMQYEILTQVQERDAENTRIRCIQSRDDLDAFSNVQVESYIRSIKSLQELRKVRKNLGEELLEERHRRDAGDEAQNEEVEATDRQTNVSSKPNLFDTDPFNASSTNPIADQEAAPLGTGTDWNEFHQTRDDKNGPRKKVNRAQEIHERVGRWEDATARLPLQLNGFETNSVLPWSTRAKNRFNAKKREREDRELEVWGSPSATEMSSPKSAPQKRFKEDAFEFVPLSECDLTMELGELDNDVLLTEDEQMAEHPVICEEDDWGEDQWEGAVEPVAVVSDNDKEIARRFPMLRHNVAVQETHTSPLDQAVPSISVGKSRVRLKRRTNDPPSIDLPRTEGPSVQAALIDHTMAWDDDQSEPSYHGLISNKLLAQPPDEDSPMNGVCRTPIHHRDVTIEVGPTQPVIESSPQPVIESSPQPVIESSPQPVIESSPQPVIESSPQPVIESSPQPVIESSQPVIESSQPVIIDLESSLGTSDYESLLGTRSLNSEDTFDRFKEVFFDAQDTSFSGDGTMQEDQLDREIAKHREDLADQTMAMEYVSQDMVDDIRSLCGLMGVPFVNAPGEAEAQCCYMSMASATGDAHSPLVDGVVTDDSDALVYGSELIIRHMFSRNKEPTLHSSHIIERELGISRNDMIMLSMLLGCDYTHGVTGIGAVNAMETLVAWKTSQEGDVNSEHVCQALTAFKKWVTDKQSKNDGVTETDSSSMKLYKQKHANYRLNWSFPTEGTRGFPNTVVLHQWLDPEVDKSKQPFSWAKPDEDRIKALFRGVVQSPSMARQLEDLWNFTMRDLSSKDNIGWWYEPVAHRRPLITDYLVQRCNLRGLNIASSRLMGMSRIWTHSKRLQATFAALKKKSALEQEKLKEIEEIDWSGLEVNETEVAVPLVANVEQESLPLSTIYNYQHLMNAPVLTLHQPWATLLVNGVKRCEGRNWITKHRGPLWIHSSKTKITTAAIQSVKETYSEFPERPMPDLSNPNHYPYGTLLGCVNVVDCLKNTVESDDEFRAKIAEDPLYPPKEKNSCKFLFICRQPLQLPIVLPCRGKQGMWKLEADTKDNAIRQIMNLEC